MYFYTIACNNLKLISNRNMFSPRTSPAVETKHLQPTNVEHNCRRIVGEIMGVWILFNEP